jgi:hypothetical protein
MLWHRFTVAYALRPNSDRQPLHQPTVEVSNDVSPSEDERWIVCRQCQQRLTLPSERISVNGSHSHTFANPSGVVFEIGCFRMVSGLNFIGPPSYEFPWFAGYSWQIVICSACQTHLGWWFRGPSSNQFYGLILDHLREIEAPE